MPKERIRKDLVYTFDELSPKAKAKAIDHHREMVMQDNDMFEHTLEDADNIAALLGITIKRHGVKLMGGTTRQDPTIAYCLHVQGSGASFAGTYAYRKGSLKLVTTEAPQDTVLHEIADELRALQAQHGYKLTATVTLGRDVHSRAPAIEVFKGDDDASDEVAEAVREALRSFMDWIYDNLNKEYDYQTSDEVIIENIKANEYEYTEDGRIA